MRAARVFQHLEHGAEVVARRGHVDGHRRLQNRVDGRALLLGARPVVERRELRRPAVAPAHAVGHERRREEHVLGELVAEPLPEDVEVQEAQEAQPQAQAQRRARRLPRDGHGRVVDREALDGLGHVVEGRAVGREDARVERRRRRRDAARQGRRVRPGLRVGDERVADARVPDVAEAARDVADAARDEPLGPLLRGRQQPELLDAVGPAVGALEAHAVALAEFAVDDAQRGDDASPRVVAAVEDARAERPPPRAVVGGRPERAADRVEHVRDAEAALGAHGEHRLRVLDQAPRGDVQRDVDGVRRGQVHLGAGGQQRHARGPRRVGDLERLRLDALGRVDE